MTWEKTIEIDWTGATFEEHRDATVKALNGSGWLEIAYDPEGLENLIDELSETDDADYFDAVWNAIYDEADYDRVWLGVKH